MATVRDGRLVKVEPGQHPDPRYTAICVRGLTHPQRVYSPDRIKYPMKRVGERGEGKFERISWDEALDTIAAKLKETKEQFGGEAIAFSATGQYDNYQRLPKLLQANSPRALFGSGSLIAMLRRKGRSANIDQAVPLGLASAGFGAAAGGGAANEWTDRPNARLWINWGSNPAETAMTSMRFFFDAQAAGTKVVVIDPRNSATAMHADWWIHPKPGTDPALALGIINVLIEQGLVDRDFALTHSIAPLLIRQDNKLFLRQSDIAPGGSDKAFTVWDETDGAAKQPDLAGKPALEGAYTVGGIPVKTAYQLLKELAAQYPPEKVESITGVPAAEVRELGITYGRLKPSTIGFAHGMGRIWQGHTVARLAAAMAALTGNIGKPGASVGSQSHGAGAYSARLGAAPPLPEWATGSPNPTVEPRVLFNAGDLMNQFQADLNWIKEWVKGLDFVVTVDHFWQTSTLWSDIVLPASTFLESNSELKDILSDRNGLLLKRKVIEPLWESKPDYDIERELGKRLGLEEYFPEPEEIIRTQIETSKDPSMKGFTLQKLLDADGALRLQTPLAPKVQFADYKFSSPTGRIQWYDEHLIPVGEELPVYTDDYEASSNHPLAKKYPLVFTQVHVRQRAHSTYFNSAWLLEIWPEPILEMNPVDAEARGLKTGDYAEAFNDRGRAVAKVVVNSDYGPGHCNITEGWKQQQFKAGHFQELTNPATNPSYSVLFDLYGMFFPAFAMFGMSNVSFGNTRVEVRKVEV